MGNTQYQTFEDNKHSVDDKIWLLERYLFAMDKKTFFSSLVYSSELYKYMRYSDYLNNPAEYDKDMLEKELFNYLLKIDNCLHDEILFKKLARDACEAKTVEERKAILSKINTTYFSIDFDKWAPPMPTPVLKSSLNSKSEVSAQRADIHLLQPINLDCSLREMEDIELVHSEYKSESYKQAAQRYMELLQETPEFLLSGLDIKKLISTGGAYKVGLLFNQICSKPEGKLILSKMSSVHEGILCIHENNNKPLAESSSLNWCEFRLDHVLRLISRESIQELASTKLNTSRDFWLSYLNANRDEKDSKIENIPDFLPQRWKEALNYLDDRWKVEQQPSMETLFKWLSNCHLFVEGGLAAFTVPKNASKTVDNKELTLLMQSVRSKPFPILQELFSAALKDCLMQCSGEEDLQFLQASLSKLCSGNTHYNKLIAQLSIELGKSYANMNQAFAEHELAEIRHKKLLRWVEPSCAKSVTVPAEAILTVELCGIKTLTLDVYSIDLYSSYRVSGLSSGNVTTELQGYKPLASKTFTFSSFSGQIIKHQFSLAELITGLGTYVVEVSGEGQAVRAEVKIGNLALVPLPWSHDTSSDQFVIIKPSGQIVKGVITILKSDKTYVSDEQSHVIVIPKKDRVSNRASEAIFVQSAEGASAITQLDCYRSTPSLEVDLVKFPGQQQPDSVAQFILRPYLVYNPVSFRRVKLDQGTILKVCFTASGIDNRDQITTRTVEVQTDGTISLDYHVAASSTRISMVIKYENPEFENPLIFSSSALEFTVSKLGEGCIDRYFINLLKTKREYIISLHGKNGETYPEKLIYVTLTSLLSKTARKIKAHTDALGQIRLPLDSSMTSIQASIPETGWESKWIVEDWSPNIATEFSITEGQNFRIPRDPLDGRIPGVTSSFEIYELVSGNSIKPMEFVNPDSSAINLTKLPAGTYNYYYTLRNIKGTVRVFPKSADVKTANVLLDSDKSGFIRPSEQISFVGQAKISEDGTIQSDIHQGSGQKAPSAFVILSNSFNSSTAQSEQNSGQSWPLLFRRYVDYKQGSSESPEAKYAKARKAINEQRVGSTLSKPTTLLNQKQDRVTEPIKFEGSSSRKDDDEEADFARNEMRHSRTKPAVRGGVESLAANDWRVWLANPGTISTQVAVKHCEEHGLTTYSVTFKIPEVFQHAQVVWLSDQGILTTPVLAASQANPQPLRKRMDLRDARSSNRIEFEEQTIKVSREDLVDTKSRKSLATLQDFYTVLCQLNAKSAKELADWDFLSVWGKLPIKTQLILYDKFASHELHIFLYFKDKEFIEEVVKPHLRNKNKKQLVDYFILGDTETLKSFMTPFAISRLSFSERILLMHHFYKIEPQTCYNYVQKLKKQLQAATPAQHDMLKKKFDSILESDTPEVLLLEKYSKPEFYRAHQDGKNRVVVKAEYVPQMSGNVSAFNAMGETNEVVDQSWTFSDAGLEPNLFWINHLEMLTTALGQGHAMSLEWLSLGDSPLELIMALSVIGLPFSNPSKTEGSQTQKSQECYILSREKIARNAEKETSSNLLVSQKFFAVSSVSLPKGSVEEKEYLRVQQGYALKTVVINGEDKTVKATLSVQIPEGATALAWCGTEENVSLEVGPFKTYEHVQYFYFSEHSETYDDLKMYPATVFKENTIIGQANLVAIKVGPQKKVDLDKMLDMFDKQGADEVADVNLTAIYSKLKDPEVYQKTLAILKRRFEFDNIVWSFSLYHGDMETAREWFKYKFANDAIRLNQFDIFYLKNDLIDVDYFNFREYSPLTNPRVHDISQYKHNIINRDFLNTYYILLKYFQDKGRFDDKDYVSLCVYLLSQDRIDQALELFRKIDPNTMSEDMRLQYDYLDCYLGFQTRDFDRIKDLASQYLLYPVLSWRKLFEDVIRQILLLEEITKETNPVTSDLQNPTEIEATGLAGKVLQSGMAFDAELVDGTQLNIFSLDLDQVKVDYYSVDLELLIASNPAVLVDKSSASQITVQPNYSETISLQNQSEQLSSNAGFNPGNKIRKTKAAVNPSFVNKDTLIRVTNGKNSKIIWNTSTALKVLPFESHGLVKVTSNQSPNGLAGCYVKCLAEKASNPGHYTFFKDGYTDIRGYFDFASLGGQDTLTGIQQFTILVASQSEGSTFLKLQPPTKTSESVGLQLIAIKSSKPQTSGAN